MMDHEENVERWGLLDQLVNEAMSAPKVHPVTKAQWDRLVLQARQEVLEQPDLKAIRAYRGILARLGHKGTLALLDRPGA